MIIDVDADDESIDPTGHGDLLHQQRPECPGNRSVKDSCGRAGGDIMTYDAIVLNHDSNHTMIELRIPSLPPCTDQHA